MPQQEDRSPFGSRVCGQQGQAGGHRQGYAGERRQMYCLNVIGMKCVSLQKNIFT